MTETTTIRPGLGAPPADNLLLDVRNLRTSFKVMDGIVPAVDGISFTLERGRDDDHAPARDPARRDRRGERDLVRRPGDPLAARERDAQAPRQRDGDDLPGAADEPQP